MKNGRSSLILILAVLLLIGGIVYYLYESGVFSTQGENIVFEKNDLYFVTESGEALGLNKSDGTQVLECRYQTILRNGNSVYLNDGVESYVFFLDNNKSISLGGKETDVNLVYDKNTSYPLPYFILTYGTGNSSVYRIYTDQGVRYNNKDFTSMNEVTTFLDSKTAYRATNASNEIKEKYDVKQALEYPTQQNRSQYIVSLKGSDNNKSAKYGIVDETGRIVLDVACDSITELTGDTNGVLVYRNEKAYLFFKDEKLQEVDTGFEFVTRT
ncbi:MAG: hypothetical protein IJ809_00705 [Clostridia bacterium]|nr:hypothetical protein [Clostridia bacterium]